MNIYKVVFTGCDWDEYDSFVVAAESAFGAEQLVKDSIPCGESIESITLLGTSIDDVDLMHSDQMTNEDVQNETTIISGYSSFLAEVNDLAKLNKSSGEQLVTQMENEPLRKVPKLSDNKKFLGRIRATRLLIYKN